MQKSTIKKIAKAILPRRLVSAAAYLAGRRQASKLSHLSIGKAFDEIYKNRIWAPNGGPLSGEGSAGRAADAYVKFITDFISEHKVHSIVDLGCGDFSVGSRVCAHVSRYIAMDVSAQILERNRVVFANLEGVSFAHANGCVDALPAADLVTVRQVMQHLTNRQIEAMLTNIESSQFRYAIVAEHLPPPKKLVAPNRDLPSHSADIRTWMGSGVYVDKPPFSRPARLVTEIAFDDSPDSDRLGIFVWQLGHT